MQTHFYDEVHDLSGSTNHGGATNSLLFFQLLLSWAGHLRSKPSFEFVTPPTPPSKSDSDPGGSPGRKGRKHHRPKRLFKIDDLIEDEDVEYVFSGGGRDDQGLPHGAGLLTVQHTTAAGSARESCVRGVCAKPISAINGTFRHGNIVGFAQVRTQSQFCIIT